MSDSPETEEARLRRELALLDAAEAHLKARLEAVTDAVATGDGAAANAAANAHAAPAGDKSSTFGHHGDPDDHRDRDDSPVASALTPAPAPASASASASASAPAPASASAPITTPIPTPAPSSASPTRTRPRKIPTGPMLGVLVGTLKRARRDTEIDGLDELARRRHVKAERKNARRLRTRLDDESRTRPSSNYRGGRTPSPERALPDRPAVRRRNGEYSVRVPDNAFFIESRVPDRRDESESGGGESMAEENVEDDVDRSASKLRARLKQRLGACDYERT